MPERVVVADASPLIALGAIRKLHLLRPILGKVVIPAMVAREVMHDMSKPGAVEIHAALQEHGLEVHPDIPVHFHVPAKIDDGEAVAIQLALTLDKRVLMDELGGRALAKRLGVRVIGSLGVLSRAKAIGLIPAVKPVIAAIQQATGYHYAPALIAHVLDINNESC